MNPLDRAFIAHAIKAATLGAIVAAGASALAVFAGRLISALEEARGPGIIVVAATGITFVAVLITEAQR